MWYTRKIFIIIQEKGFLNQKEKSSLNMTKKDYEGTLITLKIL